MGDKTRLARHIIYASKATKVAKASRFGIVASAILTFMIFAISFYGERIGNTTVSLSQLARNAGINMFENYEVRDYRTVLIAKAVEDMDAMTGLCGTEYTVFRPGDGVCIPPDNELSSVDGSNNGRNYLVYTFYVQNAGKRTVDLEGSIAIVNESKGAIEAIRVRVIIDGVGVTYAKRQSASGREPGMPEPNTEPFHSMGYVMKNPVINFQPGDIIKVTLIIWSEGEDYDHNNLILNGHVRLTTEFTISNFYDD